LHFAGGQSEVALGASGARVASIRFPVIVPFASPGSGSIGALGALE
jgi:hypothetical protein